MRPKQLFKRILREWIALHLFDEAGGMVRSGPFTGLNLGLQWPYRRLYGTVAVLGSFERELHPHIEQTCAGGMDTVINVGAAEGYYTVGLAARLPRAQIIAFETDPVPRGHIAELAELNGVRSRIDIRGYCDPEALEQALPPTGSCLVLCDVEGYERDLMDPVRVPGLRRAHLFIESHEGFVPGITAELSARFQATHRVESLRQRPRSLADTQYSCRLTRWMPALVTWAMAEPRPPDDCWLWMEPR